MNRKRVLFLAAFLSGCATLPGQQTDITADLPPMPAPPVAAGHGSRTAGGVFSPMVGSLAADTRAYRVGDTLTVTLDEETQASKRAGTSFGKKSSAAIKPNKLFGHAVGLDTAVAADRSFDGSGTSSQQNTLRGEITVVVQNVMPGGTLLVRGEKILGLNQGEEVMRVVGYVRPADIDTYNRVSSRRLANARIQYIGKGELANANEAGWLTRLINSPWMPF